MYVDRKKVICCVFAILSVVVLAISQNSMRKNKLRNILSTDVQDCTVYTPITYLEYVESYEAAISILNNPLSSSKEISKAGADLQSSIFRLQYLPNKDHLNQLYSEAISIAPDAYIPLTIQPLQDAIEYAHSVLNNENATSDEVNAAAIQIETSMLGLVEQPDKSALGELIEQANWLFEEEYTTETYNAFVSAFTNAQIIYSNAEATQNDVNTAANILQDSMSRLSKTTKGVFRINVSISRESNNHVGNSWSYTAFYLGKDIDCEIVTMAYGSNIALYCEIVEADSFPDIGSGYLYLILEDGAEESIIVSVYENRGRYSGNQAVWTVTASATLIE